MGVHPDEPAVDHGPPAINAKEAAKLLMAGEGELTDNKLTLTFPTVDELLGDQWVAKLNNPSRALTQNLIAECRTPPEMDRQYVVLDAERLERLASEPVSDKEMSLMLSRRFGNALKARQFMETRMSKPDQAQEIFCSENFVAGFLGPLWHDRMEAANLPHREAPHPHTGEPQVYMDIEPAYNLAAPILERLAAQEYRNIQQRRR